MPSVRQLGDRSGNTVTCRVHDDTFEITWPDGLMLKGKDPRPWDTILRELDKPRHSLVRQAMEVLRAKKTAS